MSLHSGQIINERYRIVRLLGEGGFGAVYRAWDVNLNGPCALKENFETSPEAQSQFKREASILFNLTHINLPRVIDHFTIPGQGQYLVMDYIEGKDLQEMLNEKGAPLPTQQVIPWIGQVCDALEYLHNQKPPIIHRDLKPANIRITPQGKAILVDFGIAKVYDPQLKTTIGARAVTPGYSPPEQYDHHASTDGRSDIYALGATLYTLLTNQEPSVSIQRMLGTGLPSPRKLNPSLSIAVDTAILKAMELQPERRFQTAKDFKAALTTSQTARLSIPGPVTPPAMNRHPSTPHGNTPSVSRPISRQSVLILLTALMLLLIGAIILGRFIPPAPPAATLRSTITFTPTPVVTQTPTPQQTLTIGSKVIAPKDGMTLVYVPAGNFLMGSNEDDITNLLLTCKDCKADMFAAEQPQHRVYVDAFWIDHSEVTNAMFAKFITETNYQTDAEKRAKSYAFNPIVRDFEEIAGADWRHPQGKNSNYQDVNHPVVQVTWNDATRYCSWAGRRLPSEVEWEKAARGEDGRLYPWGNAPVSGDLLNLADRHTTYYLANNSLDDGYPYTAPVGNYPKGASPYGALDMAGNVWEWVADWYDPQAYVNASETYVHGPDTGTHKILRGGAWSYDAARIHSAYRFPFLPTESSSSIGFRCALTAQ